MIPVNPHSAKVLPLTAAAAVAWASFTAFGASSTTEGASHEAGENLSVQGTRRFTKEDFERVQSLLSFLAVNERFLPKITNRPAVFGSLQADGVLSQLGLRPLEMRALELLARRELSELISTSVGARKSLQLHGAFSEEDVFGSLLNGRSRLDPISSMLLSPEERSDYRTMLGICFFIAGQEILKSESTASPSANQYLTTVSPQRRRDLIRLIGAATITKGFSAGSYGAFFGGRYIEQASAQVSPVERTNIPALERIDYYEVRERLALGMVALVGAALPLLYRSARARIKEQVEHEGKA